jgi:GT2 family glycosyltransferase/2-polyprenyl-3-methyl-5-hydroxy-6-metoxy-1,4-benzoquinol methylase/tetratricopeptide (TPR) repeat protein
MGVKRVALVFDNTARPETTGLYCRRALGNLVEVEHFLPDELKALAAKRFCPANSFDLYLNVDDGLRYRMPDQLRPAAYWAIDTHMDFAWSLEKSKDFDFVFAAQRDGAEQLLEAGIATASWLPLACDPAIHGKHKVQKSIDVCFVGNLLGQERTELIELIRRRFKNTFVGRRFFEQMASTYSASKIVFNRSVKNDLNMRVFEALCSGSLLVTNDLSENGQEELFKGGVHLATYTNAEDLIETIKFYLDHVEQREQIATAGRTEVHSKHTYLHRMLQLLRRVESGLSKTSVAVTATAAGDCRQTSADQDDKPRVTACLVSWKRPDNVRRIVEQLGANPIIDDILIWNNDSGRRLEIDCENVRVINADRNMVTYGRYLCAKQAAHDVIYTQDDDCLVHNIDDLHQSFQLASDCISHGLKLGHLAHNVENFFDSAQMALVGWGAFFKKEWIDVFDNYIAAFGEDDLLIRKADRLFSLLLNRRHRSTLADVSDLDGASGPEALSVKPDHIDLTHKAVSRALGLLRSKSASPNQSMLTPQPEDVKGIEDNLHVSAIGAKSRAYFEFARPELLAMIPRSARRVLDVGCGAGMLGNSIKQRQNAEVWGIERDEAMASLARDRLDRVISGDAERIEVEIEAGTLDCIICGDVLEHMRQPEEFLKQARGWLAPGGRLIASIPNVRHYSVVTSILEGNWTYESAGLLDQDHVRFFTRREIEKLFFRAGFAISERRVVPGPGYQQWVERKRPGEVRIGRLQIQGILPKEAEEFYVYQYLIEAVPSSRADYGMTSIVIVTHNQLSYTQKCIDSIRQFTDEQYELVLVDNGSSDGTRDFLRTIEGATVIANPGNRGFPAAANQGIRAARGDQVLLFNNDTLVTTGWLRRMLDALVSDPKIGLVGPCSNSVSGPQQVAVTYDEIESLDGFAWDWGETHSQQRREVDRLVGFCLLIERSVIESIGLLDEQFGIGNFEDDDYCRRAIQAGFKAVIAQDAFIHHFGSRTFRASDIDYAALLKENKQRFDEKWRVLGIGIAAARPQRSLLPGNSADSGDPSQLTIRVGPSGGLLLGKQMVRLSLCMIVRDNEAIIEDCLASIKPWVDEMIVIDTGSRDETPKVAERLGARVYRFPWCDDFSAARNESLKYARGEWIFWMDSDDTIDHQNGRKLRQLVDNPHDPSILGYVMQVHCPTSGNDGITDVTAVDHVKLFRNHPDIRFECRIHEQVLPAIRRCGGEVEFTDIFVLHSGSDQTAEGQAKKYERDFHLLELELKEKPDHPFALFNLGMTHADAAQHTDAILYLKRCLEVSSPAESQVRKAYALLVSSLAAVGRHEEAQDVCGTGRAQFPDDPELQFRTGMLDHHFGRLDDAASAYQSVLNSSCRRHFSSIDQGVGGYKARHNLAIVYEDMGRLADAEDQWRFITKEVPNYRPGWKGLGSVLVKQSKYDEAKRVADELTGGSRDRPASVRSEGLILKAKLATANGDIATARRYLETAWKSYSEDLEPLRELCLLLFEHASDDEAIRALTTLSEKDQQDGSAPHNLGTLYLRTGDLERSIDAYRDSLMRRPDSVSTYVQLGHALHAAGHFGEAAEAWERSQHLSSAS